MYKTEYHRASSIDEAVSLREGGEDATYLAGGMTIIPTMKQRLAAPDRVIDLRHIEELKGITKDGDRLRIGAGSTHFDIKSSPEIESACPGLHHMASVLGDPHVRYMGTIGGSLANNDPAADYPAAILALDATIHTNKRELGAEEFLQGLFETTLEEGELITAISFTPPERCGYEKFRNPASRYAMCGVFVARTGDDVRVGVTGAGADGAFRWKEAEEALSSNWSADALNDLKVDPSDMLSDIHGSAEYRANLVKVMARRAVAAQG